MYLKKLELLGFKSFADRTTFDFKPGITGIVGPNGCGKSNVVDAFKWILGSQSAKGLRGSEMKDVIFNGTQSRKPLGYAEVTVVFDNHDRFFDVDYAEVAVTRRLFRSGESEYLINKQKCRLKDIRNLFLDTGFGASSYSILEQGKIDVLLQASVNDRRVIFEEAAGISKYRVRKAEALRSLVRVEDNLDRLQDLIDEVEKRIRRLKAQASKARRYREYSERLKELRVRMALEDLSSSIDGRSDLSFGLYWVATRIDQLETLVQRLQGGLDEQLAERQVLLERIQQLRDQFSTARAAHERLDEKIAQSERRLVELAQEAERKKRDLEETRATLAKLEETLEEDKRQLEGFREEIDRRREQVEERVAQQKERQAQHDKLSAELRERKEEVVSLIQQRSRIANQVVQVTTELGNLQSRKERLEATLSRHSDELALCERRTKELDEQLEKLEAERKTFDAEREELREKCAELEARVESTDEELHARREELHRKSSRYEVLESFEAEMNGFTSGAAQLLRRRGELPCDSEVHGLVATLLKVSPDYALAVDAALADRAQSFVVETQDGAVDVLDYVRDEELGGVQLIALDRLDLPTSEFLSREHFPKRVFPKTGGVLGPLRELIEVEAEFAELFDRLLAGVVLVQDFPTALALARNGLRSFRLVTLTGEVVEPWGGISSSGASDTGIISRRSEMDALRVDVARLETECEEIKERRDALRGEVSGLRNEIAERSTLIDDLARRVVGFEGDKKQLQKEVDRHQKELEVGQSELAELSADIETRVEEKAVRVAEVEKIDQEREATEAGVHDLEGQLEASSEALELAGEAVSEARLELAQAEKQEEGRRQLLQEQEANLRERGRHAEELEKGIRLEEERTAETRQELEAARGELEAIVEREAELRESLEAEEVKDQSLMEIEQGFRTEIEKVRGRASELARERETLQLRDQEERHRRNTVLERIDEEYGIDLKELLERASVKRPPVLEGEELEGEESAGEEGEAGSENSENAEGAEGETTEAEAPAVEEPKSDEERFLAPLEDWDRDEAQREAKELQGKIRKLGNVNLEALDELEELEERFGFQKQQKTDLVESERNLRAIIAEINTKSREMFQETFDLVQEHFKDLFRKCFGGGRAELVLEEGVDILEAGIEIVARPPGKKLTSLSLMSGGERTMTTIALLLAIFRARPSPFCVLDEVDAPLDEANVRRFTVLLKDFVESSQFVIITHNKVTMAQATILYGVTMQERGVSKRVSVELETYDPEREEELAAIGATDGGVSEDGNVSAGEGVAASES